MLSELLQQQEFLELTELNMLIADDYNYILLLTTFDRLPLLKLTEQQLQSDMSIQDAWKYVHLPVVSWANLTGLSAKEVRRYSRVLKGNNIILPNGKINQLVYKYVMSKGRNKLLSTLSSSRRKKEAEPKKPIEAVKENG